MKKLLTILVLIMLIISFFQITKMYALYKEQLEGEYNTSLGKWQIKVNETDIISGGYDNTATTWRDLAGVQDGVINGGTWENDYLHLDGIDDWVNLGQVNFTDQVTLDATITVNEIQNRERIIVCNYEDGGAGIALGSGKPRMQVYIESVGYANVTASKALNVGEKTRITGTYDGTNISLYINGKLELQKAQTGKIRKPNNNTVMAIGTNPGGNIGKSAFASINVYSAKVYNVALTQEQIANEENVATGLIRSYDARNNSTNTSSGQTATFTIAEDQLGYVPSEYIKDGKIAPGGQAYFDIVIDPAKTDVSILYKIETTSNEKIPAKFEITNAESYFKKDGETGQITNDTKYIGENSYTSVIPVTKINEGYKNYIRLYFKWVNVEANNETDSALAEIENAKLSVPLKITLKQYTGEVIGNGT